MGILEDDALKRRQIRAQLSALKQAEQAQQDYNDSLAAANQKAIDAQGKKTSGLGSVLSGIGNSIYNTGKGLFSFFGSGLASIGDLGEGIATGKLGTREEDFKKWLYNTDNEKDAYLKAGGNALETASNLADLIPGAAMAKPIMNGVQGFASGVAQEYMDKGKDADLGEALSRGAVSGVASLGGSAIGGKIAGKAAGGTGAISKALNSQVGRGATIGGIAGGIGAGLETARQGGNLGEVLANTAGGIGQGALGGGAMAGTMGVLGSLGKRANDKILGADSKQNVAKTVSDIEPTGEKSNMIGRALKKTGNQLESAQTDITRAERRKFGIKDAGQTVENVRKRTGLSSIQDQADFAKNITGDADSVMDTIQKYNMKADKKGKPLTLTTDKYEVAINEAVGNNWKKSVMGEDYDDFRTALISDIKNEDPITASNWLKNEAATQRGIADAKGPTADKAARKARIYTDIANKIDDLSYSAVPKENVNRMFDDAIDEFRTRAQEAKAQGNKKYAKAYEKVADELEKTPRTIGDYRTFKKDFVKSSQLAEISTGAQSGSLTAGIGKGTTVKNKVLNTLMGEPTNRALAAVGGKLNELGDAINGTNIGKGKVGGTVGKLAEKASNLAKAANNTSLADTQILGNNLGDIVAKQTARQSGLAQARNADAERELENARQDAINAQNVYQNAIAQARQNYEAAAAQQQNQGQEQLNYIADAMEQAMAVGDINSYAKLLGLYQQAYKLYGGDTQSEPTKLTDNQTKALNALGQLSTLEQMTPDIGTAAANSPLSFLVDLTGGDDYANQAESLALTLGYLQSGANVSAKEAEKIGKSYIPTAFDSEAVRRNKLQRARELLNTYLYGTQYYQG